MEGMETAFSKLSLMESSVELKGSALEDKVMITAAELLKMLVDEANGKSKLDYCLDNEIKERVYELLYGTIKYLSFIDAILIQTQFFVNYQQFIEDLCLTKVAVYNAMRVHFNFDLYQPITLTGFDPEKALLIKEIELALEQHRIKLAAAFARIRIERRARGNTIEEQFENVIEEEVREQEFAAETVPRFALLNSALMTRGELLCELESLNISINGNNESTQDDEIFFVEGYTDLLCMQHHTLAYLRDTQLFRNGILLPTDKSTAKVLKLVKEKLCSKASIIDTRCGTGVRSKFLSSCIEKKQKLFLFDSQQHRLDQAFNLQNIQTGNNFLKVDPNDKEYKNVKLILCEPPNSASAIADKKQYLIDEFEHSFVPNDKQMAAMQRKQQEYLTHAMQFPNVECIIYITRSFFAEENEDVVEKVAAASEVEVEISTIFEEPKNGESGIFIACIKVSTEEEVEEATEEEVLVTTSAQQIIIVAESDNPTPVTKKKTKRRKRKSKKKFLGFGSSSSRLEVFPTVAYKHESMQQISSKSIRSKRFYKRKDKDSSTQIAETVNIATKSAEIKKLFNMAICGKALTNFYVPNHSSSDNSFLTKKKWSYPVPNPTPWK